MPQTKAVLGQEQARELLHRAPQHPKDDVVAFTSDGRELDSPRIQSPALGPKWVDSRKTSPQVLRRRRRRMDVSAPRICLNHDDGSPLSALRSRQGRALKANRCTGVGAGVWFLAITIVTREGERGERRGTPVERLPAVFQGAQAAGVSAAGALGDLGADTWRRTAAPWGGPRRARYTAAPDRTLHVRGRSASRKMHSRRSTVDAMPHCACARAAVIASSMSEAQDAHHVAGKRSPPGCVHTDAKLGALVTSSSRQVASSRRRRTRWVAHVFLAITSQSPQPSAGV